MVAAITNTLEKGMKLNLVSDVLFERALSEAKKCDLERREMVKEGKEVPLLHGIPISLSDPILVRGTSSNWCRCADLYPLQEQDSVLV